MSVTAVLLPHLPRYAEEGTLHTTVAVTELQNVLQQTGLSADAASATLTILQNLLDSLSVLDKTALEQGRWQFVSFPAQLCALSLLNTLADPQQILLDKHFWASKQHDNEIDAQRQILRAMELKRVKHHAKQQAVPVRYVYVAWALIKLDGKFLLHHREDRNRPELQTGNYVPVGGRTNAQDLEKIGVDNPLAALQSPNSKAVLDATAHTLQREVREETGLDTEDYTFSHWRALQPYREVEGAKSNHAYTEYYFNVYQLYLTRQGFFHVLTQQAPVHQFTWFTQEELLNGTTADGKTAYLKALYQDFPAAELQAALDNMPDSYADAYAIADAADSLTITPDELWQGPTGKEKSLSCALDTRQISLLTGLAAHGKRLLTSLSPDIRLLAHGWLGITTAPLAEELAQLADALKNVNLPLLDCVQNHYFHLSVSAECLYFGADYFHCRVAPIPDSKKYRLCLSRQTIETPLGAIPQSEACVEITRQLADKLSQVHKQTLDSIDEPNLKKSVRATIEDKLDIGAMGLRKLLRLDDKLYRFGCGVGFQ
jgi:8-oxo-dGTP pyrophosphatase MutT (NUDIX family)